MRSNQDIWLEWADIEYQHGGAWYPTFIDGWLSGGREWDWVHDWDVKCVANRN